MANRYDCYAVFHWCGEKNYNVYSLSEIVTPRKNVDEYKAGDTVKCRFNGKTPYEAVIEGISAEFAA